MAQPTEDSQKCVSIIFNPVSGQTDPEQRRQTISQALAEHGYQCQFIDTTLETGAKALAAQALKNGVDLLVVSGGDGTVMEALSALVGTDTPVAVLPAGTGNLLSVNLGIPITVPEAVNVALSGKPYALDLCRANGDRYFAILGGLGMDAQMIADAGREAKNKMGKGAYLWAALKNLPRRHAHVHISLDGGKPFRRKVKSVLLANMGQITGGLSIFPTASPNDGLIDIGILKAATLAHWIHLMGSALVGRAHRDPSLEVHQARTVAITTRRPQPVQFDGEEEERTRSLTVEIVPQAVHVLLPQAAPAVLSSQDEPPEVVAERTAQRRLLLPGIVLALTIVSAAVIWRRRR